MQIDVDCNLVMPRCEVRCAVKNNRSRILDIKFKFDMSLLLEGMGC